MGLCGKNKKKKRERERQHSKCYKELQAPSELFAAPLDTKLKRHHLPILSELALEIEKSWIFCLPFPR